MIVLCYVTRNILISLNFIVITILDWLYYVDTADIYCKHRRFERYVIH